ncbi:MAG: V-type ATPase subunit [Eubacterium sp.]|nr:V-type ATPase subunit [Eubacterium sp.]
MANSNHACVNAKLSAMKSRMLKPQDYETLIKAADLQEVYAYLSGHTYYKDLLKSVDAEHLHRAEIEIPLKQMKIFEIEKLMHYLTGDEKAFVKNFLVRADIECLRVLIRGLARGEDLEMLAGFIVYSKQYTTIDVDRLVKVKDWDSFKKVLIGTDYYRLLEIYKENNIEEDLFPIEKSLERYYYDRMRRLLDKLDKNRYKHLIATVRRAIDLVNLVWLYRGKKFYHLSREELLAYALRGGLKVKEGDIAKLAESKDYEALMTRLKSFEDYSFLFNHTKTLDLHMERRRERYLYYSYLKLFTNARSSLGKVVSFIRLIEYEIEDITTIIESKRYRMSVEETENYLIRSLE